MDATAACIVHEEISAQVCYVAWHPLKPVDIYEIQRLPPLFSVGVLDICILLPCLWVVPCCIKIILTVILSCI